MMIRILLLIFAFNTMVLPVSAALECQMPANLSTAYAQAQSSATEMNCAMHDVDSINAGVQCVMDSCVMTITLFSDVKDFFIVVSAHQPQIPSKFFYQIYLPVNTPPPLV